MPPELLAQFPIAEQAIEALGLVSWAMVEFEADDAIGAAAVRFAARSARRAGRHLHPGQGHGPVRPRRAGRAVGPAPRPRCTTTPASARSGAWRRRASRTAWRSSATRPTATRGSPAGATSRRRRCWRGTATSSPSRPTAATGTSPGCGTRSGSRRRSGSTWPTRCCTATSRGCARSRTACRSPSATSTSSSGAGADRATWEAFCDEWGLARLRSRPHRWR